MSKSSKHMWTKADINVLLDAWKTKTTDDLIKTMKRDRASINGMIYRIRRAGYDIPRKRKSSVISILVKEVLREKKLIK